jgi:hypothetical protein
MSHGSRFGDTASRDGDRIVRSWLHEDRHEDATRVLDTVLTEVDTTPQRSSGGTAWRFSLMNNNIVRVGLAAAAVVVIAIIAINLLPGTAPPGGEPSVSPSVEPSEAAPSVGQSPPEVGVSYDGPVPVGWTQDSIGSVPYPDDEDLVFSVTQNELVVDPGCAPQPDSNVGPSAGESVEALAGREGLEEVEVAAAAVSGLDGHQLDFVAAADGTGATCLDASEGLTFVPLFGHYDTAIGRFLYMYAGPGEQNRLIVLDTPPGGTVWIWTFTSASLDLADHLETVMEVVNGLQFESP